jgi:hypothetical protein
MPIEVIARTRLIDYIISVSYIVRITYFASTVLHEHITYKYMEAALSSLLTVKSYTKRLSAQMYMADRYRCPNYMADSYRCPRTW